VSLWVSGGRRVALQLGACAVAASTFAVVTIPAATAAPAQTISSVRKQVDALNDQAEAATERYNAAREQMASLQVRLSAAQTRRTQQEALVTAARTLLGQIAAETYKAGDLSTLSVFLGDDPDDALAASGLMGSLSDRRADAVARLAVEAKRLAASVADVAAQQKRLSQTERALQASRKVVQDKLSAATAVLSRLTETERKQIAAATRSSVRVSLSSLGIRVPASGLASCDDLAIDPPSARVQKVLDYACAQLGDPYLWAGTGPNSFDCSGLTMQAWAQAGVSIPHNAAMQSTYGTAVSARNLQPGDLVFFGSPISHVGIYIGAGTMINAPQTGDVVRIAPLRSSMVAAVRL
jgi:cell wall-associated NlpC family hydrolase